MLNSTRSILFLFSSVILLFFTKAYLRAEGGANLILLNAVNLSENTYISLDGEDIRKNGYRPGESSSKKEISEGSHLLEARNSMCDNNLAVDIELNDKNSVTVIYIYLEELRDKDGKVIKRSLKHAKFPPRKKGTKTALRFFSLSEKKPLTIKVDGESINLEKGKIYNFSNEKTARVSEPYSVKLEYKDISGALIASNLEPVGAVVLDDHSNGKIIIKGFYDYEQGTTSFKKRVEEEE